MRSLLAPLLLLIALVALAGCRSGRPKIETTVELPGTLEVTALSIEPFRFRWDEPAWRSLELSQRMLDTAIDEDGDRLFFFASWEAIPMGQIAPRMIQPPIINLLGHYGLNRDNLVIVKPWAERRSQSDATAVNETATGKSAGRARNERVTYVGHVELFNAATGEQLAEVKGELDVDPLEERDEELGDPAPEFTRLMTTLMTSALGTIDKHVREPATPPRPVMSRFSYAPQKTFEYVEEGKPSFASRLLQMDMLDAELARQNRVAFLNPGISEDLVTKLAGTTGGLYVLTPDPLLGLEEGDLITQIDNEPATPQLLQRARLSPSATALTLKKKNGDPWVAVLK